MSLVVLFTSTVSHSMVRCALKEAQRKNVDIVRSIQQLKCTENYTSSQDGGSRRLGKQRGVSHEDCFVS